MYRGGVGQGAGSTTGTTRARLHARRPRWPAGIAEPVAKAYSIRSLPSYYVVDAQGRIAERLRAVHDTQEIVAKLAESTKAVGG